MALKMIDPPVDKFLVQSEADLKEIWPWLSRLPSFLNFEDGGVYILCYEARQSVDVRTLPQNALYWDWMNELAKYFSAKGKGRYSKDDMHDLMRHNFLSYEYRKIGKTELHPVLRSTSQLDKNGFSEYLHKIDSWAADHGCYLPHPMGGEYDKYKKARI